jgi:hypothetical protein
MLRLIRAILVGTLATAAMLAGGSAVVHALPTPPPNYRWVYNPATRTWTLVLKSLIKDGQGDGKKGTEPVKSGKRICQFHGAAQACTHREFGNWSNSQQCYLQREDPQPPPGDPRWQGHTDGSIWACVREQGYDQGEHLVTRWVWLPGQPDTVVVDPVTLAYRAIASMRLAPPLIKTAPGVGQVGLVNMPVWLWVNKTENTWGPIERSASVPGLTVTASAQVKAINWTMGDGKTIRCEGPGTPYDKSMGIRDSPDCGYRYTKTSRELPKCTYPITATAQWDITWQSTLGDTGRISVTQSATTEIRIGEAVPVLVDPDGGSEPAVPAEAAC